MNLLLVFEIIGTIAFSISGALVAIENDMDIFGVIVLGLTTAVGGGIIRDLILGVNPPSIVNEWLFIALAILVALIVFLPSVRNYIKKYDYLVTVMDSIGLAIFTVIGVEASLSYDNIVLSIFTGVITGVGGGMLRDIFARTNLYIFTKHFYACASLIGAIFTFYAFKINNSLAIIGGFIVIFALRMCAAKYKWNLPKAK